MPKPLHHRLDTPGRTASTSRGWTGSQRGCSMIEALCSLAITLVLLATALPSLQDLVGRQALLAQAAMLETDLALARTQAHVQQASLRFAVHQPVDGGSCYILHSGPIGACRCDGRGQSTCAAGAQAVRVVAMSRTVRMAPLSRPLTFDAMMGTVSPTATLRLTDQDGRTVHQVINLTGRVRTCTPDPAWGGMRRC